MTIVGMASISAWLRLTGVWLYALPYSCLHASLKGFASALVKYVSVVPLSTMTLPRLSAPSSMLSLCSLDGSDLTSPADLPPPARRYIPLRWTA